MAENLMRRFEFVSGALPPDTFGVVRFRGNEGLSRCYRFEIEVVSREADLDLRTVLQHPATFTVKRDDGDIPFHGILAQFHQDHQVGEYTVYRAVLVPKLWWLGLTHHNQVFLDQAVPQLLESCLKDGGLTSADFETRLMGDYAPWEFICQYRESHLDFVSRWLEREGIYYYFAQTPAGEKAVLTDSWIAHGPMSEGAALRYQPPSGLEYAHREEVILRLSCQQQLLPQKVTLKDYNDQAPSLDLAGQAPVNPRGRGEMYYYGDHFRTQREGGLLAAVRAGEFLCREREFHGESTIPFLRPGYTFQLQDHYRKDFNMSYLTVNLEHEGSQAAYLLAGMGFELSETEKEPYYRNRFVAIPAAVQFRPARKTEKARFFGTMNARIDGAGSGQYAELDGQGRYKVILPFDLSGRGNGKASAWVRMMQPYAGGDHGMHFPLHKGTEVLLTFIDGDPDRPVIAGAVPNPETPSPVMGGNQTMAVLQTGGQNRIAIEDKAGSERILMHVPSKQTFIRMGAPNDPPGAMPPTTPPPTTTTAPPTTPPPTTPSTTATTPATTADSDALSKKVDELEKKVDGIDVETEGTWDFKCHDNHETVFGNSFTMVIGADEEIFLGNYSHIKLISALDITIGFSVDLKLTQHMKFSEVHYEFDIRHLKAGVEKIDMEADVKRMEGALVHLAGETSKLAGQTRKLAGQTSNMCGAFDWLSGTINGMAGDITTLAGSVNHIQGAQQVVVSETTQIAEIDTFITSKQVNTCMDKLEVIGNQTKAIVNSTEVGTFKKQLHANHVLI